MFWAAILVSISFIIYVVSEIKEDHRNLKVIPILYEITGGHL